MGLAIAASASFSQQAPAAPLLLQHPSLSATQVAFDYAGEIWTVPREGGIARRLVSGQRQNAKPIFSPDGTQIAFTGIYDGNIDVYVPEGVNVDVTGLTLFGHRRDWGNDATAHDAPTITVRAAGVFGTIDIWRVPAAMHDATRRDVIRHLEGKPPRQLPS